MRFASGRSGGRVTGKDTSVWQRGRSLSVNSVGQPSARSVNLGCRSRGGLAVHRCRPGS